ncbi:hypothetical protein [Vibrio furnissii]|uniref:hypothetical protein n=1 Tax=Vibrio furnissii TaxID=29494 RepID=UPI001302DB1E|nr:hypothetical protein [Vibrio furnissii]
MEYFKNDLGCVYGFELADVQHDEQVRLRIATLEQKKQTESERDDDEDLQDYDALIEELRSTIRIADSLSSISKQEMEQLLAPSTQELKLQKASVEHAWVQSELAQVQIELMYHWTDDTRATATEDEWKAYARALRDYTSLGEDDNPIVVGDARPIAPEV